MKIGWRVVPFGRVAHHLELDERDRTRFTSACGHVFICTFVDDKPAIRKCLRCSMALEERA